MTSLGGREKKTAIAVLWGTVSKSEKGKLTKKMENLGARRGLKKKKNRVGNWDGLEISSHSGGVKDRSPNPNNKDAVSGERKNGQSEDRRGSIIKGKKN